MPGNDWMFWGWGDVLQACVSTVSSDPAPYRAVFSSPSPCWALGEPAEVMILSSVQLGWGKHTWARTRMMHQVFWGPQSKEAKTRSPKQQGSLVLVFYNAEMWVDRFQATELKVASCSLTFRLQFASFFTSFYSGFFEDTILVIIAN